MISESPDGRPRPTDPGITHREIFWRAAVLRRSLPELSPPRWLDPLLLLLIAVYLLGPVAAAPYTVEEAVQGSLAADAATLLTRPQALLPGSDAPVTQESVRLAYGSLTRYAIAIGFYPAGGRAEQVPVDLTRPGLTAVRPLSEKLLTASRAGPAVLAVLGVGMLFVLTRRLLGRAAALAAILIVGLHPTIALVGRQATDAGPALLLGSATILMAVRIGDTLADGDDPRLGAWTGLALLGGLTLAAGSTAPPYLIGASAFVLAGLFGRFSRRREALADRQAWAGRAVSGGREMPGGSGRADEPAGSVPGLGGPLGWVVVTGLSAVLVWVLVSPALWGWLPERLETRRSERATLVAQGLVDPGPARPGVLRAGLGVLTDPFLTPAPASAGPQPILRPADPPAAAEGTSSLITYRQSWWSGLPLGQRGPGALSPLTRIGPGPLTGVVSIMLGVILTGAMALGGVALWRVSRRRALAAAGWPPAPPAGSCWNRPDPATRPFRCSCWPACWPPGQCRSP